MNSIKIVLIISIFFSLSYSQLQQEWISNFMQPGYSTSEAHSIVNDDSSYIYIGGNVYSNSATTLDFLTLKMNKDGNVIWNKTFAGSGNNQDYSNGSVVDRFGNVFSFGFAIGTSTGWDAVVIKYNASGVQQWVALFDQAASDDRFQSAVTDYEGNIYLTGNITSVNSNSDCFTVKINTEGNTVWSERFDINNEYDYGYRINKDISGNIYVTGRTGNGNNDKFLSLKYNNDGLILWYRTYTDQPGGFNFILDSESDHEGNLIVTGYSTGNGTNFDYATIKYDQSGNQLWIKRYTGINNSYLSDQPIGVEIDKYNNIYITGQSENSINSTDIATIKYSSDGTEEWIRRYGESNLFEKPNDIKIDTVGNIFITGNKNSNRYLTLEYNSTGELIWFDEKPLGWTFADAYSITIDKNNEVYVAGRAGPTCTTVKYSHLIGIKLISSSIPKSFILHQNYPNPFNPNTTIKFDLQVKSHAKIEVLDITGKIIETLVNESTNGGLAAGSYTVDFDAGGISSGIYFYRLSAVSGTDKYIEAKKMVVIK